MAGFERETARATGGSLALRAELVYFGQRRRRQVAELTRAANWHASTKVNKPPGGTENKESLLEGPNRK